MTTSVQWLGEVKRALRNPRDTRSQISKGLEKQFGETTSVKKQPKSFEKIAHLKQEGV